MEKLVIQSSNAEAEVTTQGGYVTRWETKGAKGGLKILYQGSELKRSGIPLLFPNFNAGEPLPSHGFGRHSLWRVEKLVPDSVTLVLTEGGLSEEFRQQYPHAFAVRLIVMLEGNSILYTLAVENTGDQPLPICPGLHPYWAVSHKQKTAITTEGISGFEAGAIDWEASPPDNSYDFSGKVTVHFPEYTLMIEDVTEQSVVKYLQVWSQNTSKPDFNFVCFEPVCGRSNDINVQPILVEPGQVWEMKVRFSVVERT